MAKLKAIISSTLSSFYGRAVGIVFLAAVIRLIFFTGFQGFDDVFYIQRSYALSQGIFTLPATHWEARIGLVGPAALVYRIFGITPVTTVFYPFVCSLLTVVAALVLGRRLWDERTGLLAGLLVAVFPLDAIFASLLFPTAPVTLLCGLGFGLFLLADAEERSVLYLAAGASFGLACVTHEAAVIALAFYPWFVVARGRRGAKHLLTVVGFVAALAVDPVAHGLMGNPAARLNVLAHAATAQGTATDVAYSGLNVHWLAEPLIRVLAERTFGLFSWLIAPLVLYRVWRPARAHDRALSVMLLSVFLWTEYGTLSIHRYAPLARLPRYLCPLTLPAMWLLAKNLRDTVQPRTRGVLLSLLAVSSLVCLLLNSGNRLGPYEAIRSVIASAHPETVVVEKIDEFPLRFAERMNPPYTLSVIGPALPTHALAVADNDQTRRRLEKVAGVARIAEVTSRRTPYQIMLANRAVLAVLRAVRPPERFGEYKEKVAPRIWTIYQLP